MTRSPKLFALIATALGLVLARPASAQYAPTFRIVGDVQYPQTYWLPLLASLPATRLDVVFYTGAGPVSASFTGVLLWDLLTNAVIVTDPAAKNDILRKSVVVTGSDGYETVLSAGELDPGFGGHQVIVAHLQNGVPLDSASGFARIIAPNDKAGGRDVFTIARIRVISAR
jgi:hypothetical protein